MEDLLKEIYTLLKPQTTKQRVLVVETKDTTYTKAIVETLSAKQDALEIYIWPSTEFGTVKTNAWIFGKLLSDVNELHDVLASVSLCLIPSLSKDLLVKGALMMSDTSSSYALQEVLLRNIPVIAVDSGINKQLDAWRLIGLDKNKAYLDHFKFYAEKLADLGVQIISIFEIEPVLKEAFSKDGNVSLSLDHQADDSNKEALTHKQVLTYQDVIGKDNVTLDDNMKLTDMALDYLLRKKLNE